MFRYSGHPMVRSVLPQPVGGRFRIVAEALLALAKRLLGPLAVLDVGRRPVPFHNVAGFVAQRYGLEQKPAIFTIETPEPGFERARHTGFPSRAPLHQHVLLVVRIKSARPADYG